MGAIHQTAGSTADTHRWYINPTWPGFAGHFPGNPILPAAEIIDACLGLLHHHGLQSESLTLLSARFLHTVKPGDCLTAQLTLEPRIILLVRRDIGQTAGHSDDSRAEIVAELRWQRIAHSG